MELVSISSFLLAVIALALTLVLPGAVWLLWTKPARLDVLEWLAEAAASSLSWVALLGMLFAGLGIRLDAFGVGAICGALLLGWITVKIWQGGSLRVRAKSLLLIGGLLALVAWRFYQARALVLPAWVDSVHHTLLVRLILEGGGIPTEWLPYLPVPMFYHYGFHASAALFSFFSAIEPAQTLLVFGQVLNALTAVAVYRLGKAVWGNWKPALAAGLLVGFVFQMPAYYVTWGRYPLLAGLVILPLGMTAVLDVRRYPRDWSAWGRLALYTAGLCFCHFLAVGLLGLFLLVLGIYEAVKTLRARSWRMFGWQPFAAAGVGVLAASAWLARVWTYSQGYFDVSVANPFDAAQAASNVGYLDYLSYLLGPWRGHFVLILAGIGLLFAFKKREARLLASWGVGVALLATPWGPRFDPFRPDHMAIVLFLPASLLAGNVLVRGGEALSRVWSKLAGWMGLWVAVGALVVWGFVDARDILNPVTIFTTPADAQALDWIEQNTPVQARFWINSTGWQSGVFRGVDGGYWITPLTGRATLPPPAVYGWGTRDDIRRMADMLKRANQATPCSEEFWALVNENRLTHIYLREGVGALQPGMLQGCEAVKTIYQRDGVWVYSIILP